MIPQALLLFGSACAQACPYCSSPFQSFLALMAFASPSEYAWHTVVAKLMSTTAKINLLSKPNFMFLLLPQLQLKLRKESDIFLPCRLSGCSYVRISCIGRLSSRGER